MSGKLIRQDLVLPELSYAVVGALFEVSNEFGNSYQEKYYYPAVKKSLEKRGLSVKTQIAIPIKFQDERISQYIVDFLIEDKIVLELKVSGRFRKSDFFQLKAYLQVSKKPLGILARIASDGVTFHRVLPDHHL